MEKKSLCRKRKRGECESNDNAHQKIDRISDLPNHIIHHIFSFLPARVVARTSVVSKKLRWAWLSNPNLDFDQGDFKVNGISEDLGSVAKKEVRVQRKKFIEHVENSLRRFCYQKLSIQKFKLKMSCCYYFQKSHWIDKWINSATRNHVKDLVLDFVILKRNRLYELPLEIFACKSITVLELHNCVLKLRLSKGGLRFHSLQKLHLEEVRVDGCKLDELFASCPSIEQVCFRNCKGLKILSVQGLLRLKTLEFSSYSKDSELVSLNIEAPKLQFSDLCAGYKLTTVINVSECTKLKVLTLSGSSTTVINIMSIFFPKEISQGSYPSFCELEHLRLLMDVKTGIDASKPSYAALIDGFFWSCHPKTLSLVSGTTSNNNFIKFLCKSLLNNKRPNCCNNSHIKCWRHYLEDLKIKCVETVEEYNPHLRISKRNSWKIPQVLLEERPLRWRTLLRALPRLGVAYIRISLNWRSLV